MTLWPIADVLPHAEDMILLDQIEAFESDRIVCLRQVTGEDVFADGEGVPAWTGVELMAQAIAAWAGCTAREEHRPVRLGFLLGTRHYRCNVNVFPVGATLRVEAIRAFNDEHGMGVFACRIDAEDIHAEARLTVFSPPNASEFLHHIEQDATHG